MKNEEFKRLSQIDVDLKLAEALRESQVSLQDVSSAIDFWLTAVGPSPYIHRVYEALSAISAWLTRQPNPAEEKNNLKKLLRQACDAMTWAQENTYDVVLFDGSSPISKSWEALRYELLQKPYDKPELDEE